MGRPNFLAPGEFCPLLPRTTLGMDRTFAWLLPFSWGRKKLRLIDSSIHESSLHLAHVGEYHRCPLRITHLFLVEQEKENSFCGRLSSVAPSNLCCHTFLMTNLHHFSTSRDTNHEPKTRPWCSLMWPARAPKNSRRYTDQI